MGSNGTEFSFDEGQLYIIRSVYATSASLSLVGSIFILLTYLCARRIHTFVLRLVFCLAISDLGYSMSSLLVFALPVRPGEPFTNVQEVICQIQGGGIEYFQLSSFLWTSCIAWHACSAFVRKKTKADLESYFKYYVFISWALPAIPVAILFSMKAIDLADSAWCWINHENSLYRFYLFWGPVFFIWVFDCICYWLVRKNLREVLSFMERSASRRILGYVLAFIVVISLPLTNRIVQLFIPPQFALFVLHAAFDPLLGFCNAIVYGWNKQLRQTVARSVCKCFYEPSTPNIQGEHADSAYSTEGDVTWPSYKE